MNAKSSLVVLNHLTRDTFRQARASGVCWMMLAITAICFVLCLSVSVSEDVSLTALDEPVLFLPPPVPVAVASRLREQPGAHLDTDPAAAHRDGIETISGRMSLAFGAISFPVFRTRSDAVFFLELVLAWGVAGTFGVLLALVWTAGFVPSFLEPSSASVLLAKPVARWQLLFGKYLGVLAFVAFQVVLFVLSTWLALGLRTNVWNITYWRCIPLLLLQFATYYSFSILIAVITRSTVASVFGSVLFWLLGWAINYGYVMARGVLETQHVPYGTLALAEVAYWIFPKPIDAGLIVFNTLGALGDFDKPAVFRLLESGSSFSPCASIASSLLLTGVLLAISVHEFNATDY